MPVPRAVYAPGGLFGSYQIIAARPSGPDKVGSMARRTLLITLAAAAGAPIGVKRQIHADNSDGRRSSKYACHSISAQARRSSNGKHSLWACFRAR